MRTVHLDLIVEGRCRGLDRGPSLRHSRRVMRDRYCTMHRRQGDDSIAVIGRIDA